MRPYLLPNTYGLRLKCVTVQMQYLMSSRSVACHWCSLDPLNSGPLLTRHARYMSWCHPCRRSRPDLPSPIVISSGSATTAWRHFGSMGKEWANVFSLGLFDDRKWTVEGGLSGWEYLESPLKIVFWMLLTTLSSIRQFFRAISYLRRAATKQIRFCFEFEKFVNS